MQTFVDAEDAYLAWVGRHTNGYVLNAGRTDAPSTPVVLHGAACRSISGAYSNYPTRDYIKICSLDWGELERWAGRRPESEFRVCPRCLD